MLLELAAGLGERLRAAEAQGLDGCARGFELCLARRPDEAERALLRAHHDSQLQRQLAAGAERAAAELHAWTAVARVLFNLDEFLTRE
jgi:hypothetical protein